MSDLTITRDEGGVAVELRQKDWLPCNIEKDRQAIEDCVAFLCSLSIEPGDTPDRLAQRLSECEGLTAYVMLLANNIPTPPNGENNE